MDRAEIDRQIAQFAAFYPFALDPFQIEAIRTFLTGDSVMVAAPTGTGKTVIAELGVYEGIRRRGRVFYTTPIKALSNQKFRDLRQVYGDEVGLLTGDVSENAGAQVVVMTTEVLRNMLLQTPWELDTVDVIIFDEIHYLADPERGTTWEESIILCPEHIQLVCLSATVANAGEIAAWIGRTHRPITLVTHDERAVPLALYYFLDDELRLVIDHTGRQVADFPDTGGEIRRRGTPGAAAERTEPHPNDVVRALRAADLLPAIYFLFSRRDCESYAELCANLRLDFVRDRAARDEIEAVIEAHVGQLTRADRMLGQVQLVTRLARRGLGFHHAGLLPLLKQLVEQLFGRGLMQVVFATDTLALGVNMPARSVVVGRMSKWDGQRRRPLIPNEFQQMAGRAGRRGMDEEGHVVVPYSPYITFAETLAIATGPLHPVQSAFKVRYNTVLNLWDPPRGERVQRVLSQSLAQFQGARRVRELEDGVLAAQQAVAEVPRGCLIGYDDGDDLLHEYGRLGKAVEAAQRKARSLQEELERQRSAVTTPPWQEPGRQAVRNAFRTLVPGSLVHLRRHGWSAFLGRGGEGIGLFLPLDPPTTRAEAASPAAPADQPDTAPASTTEAPAGAADDVAANPASTPDSRFPTPGSAPLPVIRALEYRQVDYLTPRGAWIELPPALLDLPGPVADVTPLIGEQAVARLRVARAAAGVPDLDAWAARHRAQRARQLAGELAHLEAERDEAQAQGRQLIEARNSHVCHDCPVRKEHRHNQRRRERLEAEYAERNEQLTRESRLEEERVRGIIRSVANVLHRFGYLHRGQPTGKADMLAGIFDNNGLIIAELLDQGLLDALKPADLAEVFSWFAFDREFRYANRYQLPPHLLDLRERIDEVQRAVLASERYHHLFISTGYNETFFGAVRAWCDGALMSRLTEAIELSEGDLVLTINKTLDLMRQVRQMLATVMPNHPLRATLAAAERLALRDIVAQSYTVGLLPQSPDTSDAEAVNLAGGEEALEPADS
ncbi:MAG TPA: DEAD/DEAH box helicase [Thermomicrobiales bacterium]|nr:DEAD/DEAH box helicase [Thermomicrobiales bacterium]